MYSSQTPIDIHCVKIVDWLVQHRHCKRNWGENLASIRRKIRTALRDMPENEEIRQLLVGSKLDYFKSRQIVEILKTTEASSKNIFGYYSSQRMKDWQDIVNCYENGCIYLVEIATDLIRETSYEVPGIRKVIGRLNREKEETEKERANLIRRAQQTNSEYQKLAQSYGIKGINVVQELGEKSRTLYNVMTEVVELSKHLRSELDYYREYASSTSKQDSNKFISMLHYVISKGNTTIYEWKIGEAPESIEAIKKATSIAELSVPSETEIADDEIDFGEDIPSSDSSSGFVHVASSDRGNGDSTIEETFIKVDNVDSGNSCDLNDKIARGDDAKLVLELRKTRNQFLNNLHELEAFFIQLSNDLTNEDDRLISFLGDVSSRVRRYEADEMERIIARIHTIIDIFNKEKNKILFQISDSPIFVENIKEKFAKKLKQASDYTIKAKLLDDRLQDLETQVRETEIQLKKSVASAKELQQKVESSLSDLYSGRFINIMGCVS